MNLSPTYSLIDLGGGKTHLKVFLDNQSLFLYNYSLSENSLGIKLECKSKGVPLILESDLANSSITGCPNPPLSGGPCTKIALIPPLALSFYTREFLS
ncbi:hypothetical protein CQA57_07270 [Helicobacter anseris]|uniref:Uncharacterized protein n=1 Tax=Helicobacter anseris TaxID=375926 RepID=A0A3D8J5C5_9HELI|nr:hypothetical protein CQA57_07270 [Helicobacter anseris]